MVRLWSCAVVGAGGIADDDRGDEGEEGVQKGVNDGEILHVNRDGDARDRADDQTDDAWGSSCAIKDFFTGRGRRQTG